MSGDTDRLQARVESLERAIADGHELDDLADAGAAVERLDDLERRVTILEDRIEEFDAALQAVRGYVGNVRAVNRSVERRADAALAAVQDTTDDGRAQTLLEAHDGGDDRESGTDDPRYDPPVDVDVDVDTVVDRVRDAL